MPPTSGLRARRRPPAEPSAIGCAEAARRLWDFVDAGLPAERRAEVAAHLRACAPCASHVGFARALRAALAASRRPGAAPDGPTAGLRPRVEAALRGERPAADPPFSLSRAPLP